MPLIRSLALVGLGPPFRHPGQVVDVLYAIDGPTQGGQIIEVGDHPTLLAQGGHYATLYATYSRHQALAYEGVTGA